MTFNAVKAQQAEQDFINSPTIKNRNKLIMCHTRLVQKIVYKYTSFLAEEDKNDLFQEGIIGLIVAAEKFDPSKNVKFSTYAVWWIRSKIQSRVTNERAIYYNTIKKIAFDSNPSKKLPGDEERRLLAIRDPLSLTESPKHLWSNDSVEVTWQEIIPDPNADTEDEYIKQKQIELLYTIAEPFLSKSKYRKPIFEKRLTSDDPKTLKELGKELNLSREGVRLHEKALLYDLQEAFKEHRI